MSEKGVVVNLKNSGKTVVVEFNRTEACAKCRACMAGFTESKMHLEVKNNVDAHIGDVVAVELPENGFFAASVIVYILPLAAMVLGFVVGWFFAPSLGFKGDLAGFALGIGLLAASYYGIRLNENKFKSLPIFLPYIAEVSERAK